MLQLTIRGRRSCRQPGRRRGFLGRVECLEPRALLATIAVTGTSDAVAVDGVVTLREAILSANSNANINGDVVAAGTYGNDTITVPAGTYTLSIPGNSENAAATGD